MIEYSRIKKIHFVGIGGSGMSGIAEVLHNMGFEITGSDLAAGSGVNRLRSLGIRVFLGHRESQVADAETLVYSSAITPENAEVKTARERKIPVVSRAEMLAELMRMKFSIAVAGTHGKTTTTSMISSILGTAGKDPTYVVGGKLKIEESGAKLGRSTYLIAEADESDGSFLKLFPTIAVITNIEDDHIDYYKTMENLRDAFENFCNKVPFYGSVIINTDCRNSRLIIPALNKRVISYGSQGNPDFKASRIRHSLFQSSFDLRIFGKNHGTLSLNVGGFHNVMNSLAAVAAAYEIGLEIPVIQEGLKRFFLPERRFQVLFFDRTNLVIDDYAHHPTEISATIDTLRSGKFKRLIVVFQPHRFTRLKLLADKFAGAFSHVDKLIISKLYSAGQKKIENVDSPWLMEKIRSGSDVDVEFMRSFDHIFNYLKAGLKKGDAVAFLSAGDLTRLAHKFAKWLESSGGGGEK